MSLLLARDIEVRFDGHAILQGAGLGLRSGELVGLIGPNGAGKTTLLRVMAQLQAIDAGEVSLDGRPLTTLSPRKLARRLGYLEQGAPAHWPLAVETLVALGRIPHLGWWQRPGESDRVAIDRAMALTEVTHLRERIVTTLSGGERLRCLLARVLAAQPDLILADEPVAALDPYHQLHVMEILRAHAEAGGAVVAVLHDLNLAARFCHRLLLLDAGRVIAEGIPEDVLTAQHLRDVYGIEARVRQESGDFSVVPWRRAR